MRVPLLDLKSQYKEIKQSLFERWSALFDSASFVLGEEVESFEREVSDYLGVQHAVGVTSGTDALIVAMRVLEIGPGHQVLTSPFSFFATYSSITAVGAVPVFADVCPKSFNLDPERVEDVLRKDVHRKIRALIPIHLYGQASDMDAMKSMAQKYHLALIEDAAQAVGANYQGKKVGGFGDFGCFSFFPSKNLSCLGDGGLLTTQDSHLNERARLIRNHGSRTKYVHEVLGGNYRLDTLQAAALREFLPHLENWLQKRQQVAAFYDRTLPQGILTPTQLSNRNHVFHQYTIQVPKNRDELQKFLAKADVASAVYYPVPGHLQPALKFLSYQEGAFPISERLCQTVLSIPIHPQLTTEQQQFVVDRIAHWFRL